MKLKLLILISLIFGMLHTSAMPNDKAMLPDTQIMECTDLHCTETVHEDSKPHKCCSSPLALHAPFQHEIAASDSNTNHIALAPSPIKNTPNLPLRPPKFRQISAG